MEDDNIFSHSPKDEYSMIGRDVFLGFMWAGVAVSTCFIAFRLAVRWKVFKRLDWDDALIVFSLLMFAASAIGIQTQIEGIYVMFKLANWSHPSTPEEFRQFTRAQRAQIPAILFFFLERYSVKVSFLIFFRRLFYHVHRVKIFWWTVLIFTTCLLCICLALVPWSCLSRDVAYIVTKCTTNKSQMRQMVALDVSTAADVVTDCLITAIPIFGLYNAKIPLKQKVVLSALFSLILVVVTFAIVRCVAITATKKLLDTTWYFFWTQLEITIANIIACLCTFRQLFLLADFGTSGSFIGGIWTSIKSKVSNRQVTKNADDSSAEYYHDTWILPKKLRVPSLSFSEISRWTLLDRNEPVEADKNIYIDYRVDVTVEHGRPGLFYPAKAKVVCSSSRRINDYEKEKSTDG